jgi:hypothetical protein
VISKVVSSQRKAPPISIVVGGRVGGPRASLDNVEKKKALNPPEIESQFLGRPARSLVTILTELPKLRISVAYNK